MKTKDSYPLYRKIVIGIISILFILTFNLNQRLNQTTNTITLTLNESEKALNKNDIINNFINEKEDLLNFYSNTFQIDKNIIIEHIKEKNIDSKYFNEFDIFASGIIYKSSDESLINYLFNLQKNNPKLFSNKRIPCNKDSEYIIGLIDYYTSIYTNVDSAIAKSIALIESGYKSKTMLNKNNIFGGMSKNGLITYKNIEYGVLKYIELLSRSYFGKGLNTVEKIGYKYNPTYDTNGKKIASPTWVANVKKATNKYKTKTVNNFDELIELL